MSDSWVAAYLDACRNQDHFDRVFQMPEKANENEENADDTSRWFWEFSAISPIHGLSFIADSRGKPVRLGFWLCIVATLFCLCTVYTVGLVESYLAQPTAIAIQTTSNLSNFVFPSAAGCAEIDFLQYLSLVLGNETETTFNQTLVDFTNSGGLALLQSQDAQGVSTQLLGLNGASPTSTIPPLSANFAAASYALLALMMDYDRGQPTSTLSLATELPSVLPLIDIAQAYFDANSVDYRFLARVIGAYISVKIQMQFTLGDPSSTLLQGSSLENVVWLGAPGFVPQQHLVCLSFGNWTMFENMQESLTMEVRAGDLYRFANSTAACSSIATLNIYFDPNGGRSTRNPSDFDALTPASMGIAAFGGLEATGRYVWLNRPASSCTSVDQFVCAEKKLFEEISASRQCESLMQALSEPNMTSSKMAPCAQRYTLAKALSTNEKAAAQNWQSILAACPRQCEYTRFTSQLDVQPGDGSGSSTLEVYPQPIVFFTNVEYYLMDGETFLNAFGGLIGWWFGGSFIAVAHIIVFAIKHVVQWLLRRAGAYRTLTFLARHQRIKLFHLRLMRYCREFTFISDFHGFAYVAKESNFVVLLVWLTIIPLCIAVGVQQTGLLVQLYLQDPLSTSIKIQSNESQSFDDAAVCIEFTRSALFSTNASSSVIDFNETLQHFVATGQLDFLRQIPQVVNGAMLAALDARVMLMSHMMATAFIDFDYAEPAAYPAAYTNQTVLDEVDLLRDLLVANGVDFFQLTKLNAAFICEAFQLKVFLHSFDASTSSFNRSTYNPCYDLPLFTWMSDYPLYPCTSSTCVVDDYMCAKLPANLTSFASPHDYLSIQQFANPGASTVFLLFDLRRGVGSMDPSSFDGEFCASSSAVAGSIIVSSESRQYNSSSSPCSASPTLFDCAQECFLRNISKSRDCWSLNDLTLALKPPGMQPCLERYSFDQALNLLAGNTSGARPSFGGCDDSQCLPPCISRTYYIESTSIGDLAEGALFEVDIHQGAFVYFIYEGQLQVDIWAFFSALGGTVGLWTGGSVIALLHVPAFLLSALFRHFRRDRHAENLEWFLAHEKPRHNI